MITAISTETIIKPNANNTAKKITIHRFRCAPNPGEKPSAHRRLTQVSRMRPDAEKVTSDRIRSSPIF